MNYSKSLELIRTQGYRLTRPRRLVLDILGENGGHLEAEEIYRLAKVSEERISLATVYRCLALCKEAGLVQEHSLGQDHGHFESASNKPHYHFSDLACGEIIEFDAAQVEELAEESSETHQLKIVEAHVLFQGYCAGCRKDPNPGN